MKAKQVALGGIVNNPVFVLVLGTCPTLAVSYNLFNSIGLGLATAFVLVFSNLLISLLRKVIPDKVRIPCYILIIATLVTIVDLFMAKFIPDLHKSVGQFIALITVNCIILARAEAFANNNPPHLAMLDGISMGIGFTLSIGLLGALREILSAGTILGFQLFDGAKYGISIMGQGQAAGAFILFGLLMAIFNQIYQKAKTSHDRRLKLARELEEKREAVNHG